MHKSGSNRITATLIGAAITVLLLIFLFSGDNASVIASVLTGEISKDELASLGASFGTRGKITVAALSAVQVIFAFLPAEPAQMLGGVLYGFGGGVLLSVTGVFIGNTAVYLLYGILGEKLRNYFSASSDVNIKSIKSAKAFTALILIMYILPAIPYGLICFFAVSFGMKYQKYIAVTMLGSMPSVLIGVALGQLAVRSSIIVSAAVFLWIVIGMAVIYVKRKAILAYVSRRLTHRHGGKDE